MPRRHWLRYVLVFVCAISGSPAIAEMDTQHWPERQVRMVVTFPPGAANEPAARILADGLSTRWGKTIVVEESHGRRRNARNIELTPRATIPHIALFCRSISDSSAFADRETIIRSGTVSSQSSRPPRSFLQSR